MAFFGVIGVLFAWKSEKWFLALKFSVGWAFSYFPFYLIPRVMYLYHYIIPLIFGSICFGVGLDLLFPAEIRGFVTVVCCCMAVVGFVMICPYCYGSVLWDQKVVIWNSAWIYGDSAHQEAARAVGKGDVWGLAKGVEIHD
jgi:dolichyl-phosphate-mannose--protein O-mannosyl transferase